MNCDRCIITPPNILNLMPALKNKSLHPQFIFIYETMETPTLRQLSKPTQFRRQSQFPAQVLASFLSESSAHIKLRALPGSALEHPCPPCKWVIPTESANTSNIRPDANPYRDVIILQTNISHRVFCREMH